MVVSPHLILALAGYFHSHPLYTPQSPYHISFLTLNFPSIPSLCSWTSASSSPHFAREVRGESGSRIHFRRLSKTSISQLSYSHVYILWHMVSGGWSSKQSSLFLYVLPSFRINELFRTHTSLQILSKTSRWLKFKFFFDNINNPHQSSP